MLRWSPSPFLRPPGLERARAVLFPWFSVSACAVRPDGRLSNGLTAFIHQNAAVPRTPLQFLAAVWRSFRKGRRTFGEAHAADTLTGVGRLDGTEADLGGCWRVPQGVFECTNQGVRYIRRSSEREMLRRMVDPRLLTLSGAEQHRECESGLAFLDTSEPCGLVGMTVYSHGKAPNFGLIWRGCDARDFWCVIFGRADISVYIVERGVWALRSRRWQVPFQAGRKHVVRIVDDGSDFAIQVDGRVSLRCVDDRLRSGSSVGILVGTVTPDFYVRDLEARPQSVQSPGSAGFSRAWRTRDGTPPLSRILTAWQRRPTA